MTAEDAVKGFGKVAQVRATGEKELTMLNASELYGVSVVKTMAMLNDRTDKDYIAPELFGNTRVVFVEEIGGIVTWDENTQSWQSGKTQTTFTNIDDLAKVTGQDGDLVSVKQAYRGGDFIYDSTKAQINNGGTIINGWVRQFDGAANVKWFGAKGDGVTDDIDSINAALKSELEVFFPAGTYVMYQAMEITKETKIIGAKPVNRINDPKATILSAQENPDPAAPPRFVDIIDKQTDADLILDSLVLINPLNQFIANNNAYAYNVTLKNCYTNIEIGFNRVTNKQSTINAQNTKFDGFIVIVANSNVTFKKCVAGLVTFSEIKDLQLVKTKFEGTLDIGNCEKVLTDNCSAPILLIGAPARPQDKLYDFRNSEFGAVSQPGAANPIFYSAVFDNCTITGNTSDTLSIYKNCDLSKAFLAPPLNLDKSDKHFNCKLNPLTIANLRNVPKAVGADNVSGNYLDLQYDTFAVANEKTRLNVNRLYHGNLSNIDQAQNINAATSAYYDPTTRIIDLTALSTGNEPDYVWFRGVFRINNSVTDTAMKATFALFKIDQDGDEPTIFDKRMWGDEMGVKLNITLMSDNIGGGASTGGYVYTYFGRIPRAKYKAWALLYKGAVATNAHSGRLTFWGI